MDHPGEPLKVLLVEDDEDDYFLARELFAEFQGRRVQLDWMKTFASGLEAITRNHHDICLVDYRLGAQNGIELLRTAFARGCKTAAWTEFFSAACTNTSANSLSRTTGSAP
jgi:DNA-binding response OmpR family regulator